MERLEEAIREAVPEWSLAEVVAALQAMRGIDLIAAVGVLAEIGDLSRFQNPRELMGYLGLVSSESSTGGQGQAWRHHEGRQWAGATHSCGGGLELSISRAREPKEAAEGGGRTETCARDRLESANTTVRALPVTRAEGQAANRNRHGDCPRAIGVHLGDQSRGHARSRGVTSSGAVDRSCREVRSTGPQPLRCNPDQIGQLTDQIKQPTD